MKQKLIRIAVDIVLITLVFAITDWLVLRVFHSEKRFVELLVYLVFYALVFGGKQLICSAWKKHRKNNSTS